jgi:hypothetical protein
MENMTDTFENTMQLELNRTKAALEVSQQTLRRVQESLQSDLVEWADNYLTAGDESHSELNELMQNNGLEGLTRKFTVTVHVNYTFEVEVEATSEDEARDLVDNDVYDYIRDNIDLSYYDDVDIEATEA